MHPPARRPTRSGMSVPLSLTGAARRGKWRGHQSIDACLLARVRTRCRIEGAATDSSATPVAILLGKAPSFSGGAFMSANDSFRLALQRLMSFPAFIRRYVAGCFFARQGVEPVACVWNDGSVDWSGSAVPHTTWDYFTTRPSDCSTRWTDWVFQRSTQRNRTRRVTNAIVSARRSRRQIVQAPDKLAGLPDAPGRSAAERRVKLTISGGARIRFAARWRPRVRCSVAALPEDLPPGAAVRPTDC